MGALFPVFAVLEKQAQGSFQGQLDVDVQPLEAGLTQAQLRMLTDFVAALPVQAQPPAQGKVFVHPPGDLTLWLMGNDHMWPAVPLLKLPK